MNPLQQPGFSRWAGAVTLAMGLLVSGVGLAAPRPSISSISPNSAIAGGPGFQLIVLGDNFDSSSRVLWNGAIRTTRVSFFGNRLEADILSSDIASAGRADISVMNQDENGTEISNQVRFTINNPLPVISSISPSSAVAGGPDFTLTVVGSGFVTGSIVRFGNSNRNTTFVSASQLSALIRDNDIRNPGTASVTVSNPDPGGGTSAPATFTIIAPLTITTSSPLPPGVLGSAYSQTLTASGGTPPYSWSVVPGSLPAGLALAGSTGTLSGTPTAPGSSTFTVRVSDSQSTPASATKEFTLTIQPPPLAITTASTLPQGMVGTAYSQTLAATGGIPPYTWSVATGSPPAGLTLAASTGVLSGTPSAPGSSTFTIRVSDSQSTPGSVTKEFTLTIQPASLAITTASTLPQGVVGSAYSQTLAATGGIPPYTWSVATGSPPAGLTLAASTGILSGTPSTHGSSTFTVRVRDSQSTPGSTTKDFTLAIQPAPLAITTASTLPGGVVGTAYSQTLAATGGIPPYTWSVTAGSLPAGLTLAASTGILSGTPSAHGSSTFTVRVSDSQSTPGSATKQFTLTIQPPPLAITTASPLPDGAAGTAYSQTLTATGGVPPYSWAVTSGSLPAELTLSSSTGAISGTPSAAGNYTFTAQVSDALKPTPGTATKTFALTVVVLAPVLTSISPTMASAGGPGLPLTVNGSNFVSGSTVRWNGADRTTTFVSALQLTASIPASDIATPGTATVSVISPGGSTSNSLPLVVSPGTLAITSASSLPKGIVGYAYSQTLTASGGPPPFNWSVSSGALPTGLTLDQVSGVIGGTPSIEGNFTFAVLVRDSSLFNATKEFQLAVNPTPPGLVVSGVSDTVDPAQQPVVELTLPSPYPSPISGQMTLAFSPNAEVPSDDPAIQFSTGGRTVNFSIPANDTRAIFSNNATNVGFQTGTVAGTISLSIVAQTEGITLNPSPPPGRTMTLSRVAPVITRLNISSRSASGFELAITGYSTSRALRQVTFLFTPAAGKNLQTSTVTLDLAPAATTWFQSETSAPFGGQFRVLMPFTVQGDVNAIGSVSVTLTNAEGTSQAVAVQF